MVYAKLRAVGVSLFRLLVLFPVLMSLGIPAAGQADIYQWTDQRGGMVLSNVPPTNNDRARDVKLFVKGTKPAATTAPAASSGAATPPAAQPPASKPPATSAPAASSEPVASPAGQEIKNRATSTEERGDSVPRRRRPPRSSDE